LSRKIVIRFGNLPFFCHGIGRKWQITAKTGEFGRVGEGIKKGP
jgi:hypothetical protein